MLLLEILFANGTAACCEVETKFMPLSDPRVIYYKFTETDEYGKVRTERHFSSGTPTTVLRLPQMCSCVLPKGTLEVISVRLPNGCQFAYPLYHCDHIDGKRYYPQTKHSTRRKKSFAA